MDSRLWSDNVILSHWINQCRKKGLIVLYSTQHMSQIDLRVRRATDIQVVCEEKYGEILLTFVDYLYERVLRKFIIDTPSRFYSLYDSFAVLVPLK